MTTFFGTTRTFRRFEDGLTVELHKHVPPDTPISNEELSKAIRKLYPAFFAAKPSFESIEDVDKEIERLKSVREKFHAIEIIRKHISTLDDRLSKPDMPNQGATLQWFYDNKKYGISLGTKITLQFCQALKIELTQELNDLLKEINQ